MSISMESSDFWFFLSGEDVSFVGLRILGSSALRLLPLIKDVIRWFALGGGGDFFTILSYVEATCVLLSSVGYQHSTLKFL